MIERYCLPKMMHLWSDEHRFSTMLAIEILACEAMVKLGRVPKKALDEIKRSARFDVSCIREIEKTTQHDVVAFIKNVSENIGPAAKYIHQGLTSSDVLDTVLSVVLQEASDILIDDLKILAGVLKKQAKRYKTTIMIGRTHGVHAEPTTFGLKLALFFDETNRNIERMKQAKEGVCVGKISGAVGTYANIDPFVEEYVCKKMGLSPCKISTQIIQRDRHAQYLATIAIIGSSLERFSLEIRHLQRTEVLEAEEPFKEGQKGSSAMPHKRNPIICERICGLARVLRANALVSLENIALWHERDISHSSAERIIIPDSTILLDYILNLTSDVFKDIKVHPDRMVRNLNLTKGLVFSQQVMLALIDKGLSRNEAYDVVQSCSKKVWQGHEEFKKVLSKEPKITRRLSDDELNKCFDLRYHTKYVDRIFKRVGIE